MSKMNELSIDEQETAYAEYVESMNQDIRKEGAEELRKEILRQLDEQISRTPNKDVELGLHIAAGILERASI